MQFLFADHILDTDRRELRRSSQVIAVEPQVFDLLIYLLSERQRVVSRDDLIASVWGGRIVSESTLTSRINAARRAIGDSGKEQKLIRTFARKGFRFVGAVQTLSQSGDGAAATGDGPTSRHAEAARDASADRPAIAVLPFTNLSEEPEQEYFSDGISEDIITALYRLRWFHVIARNSSFIYKRRSTHLRQIGDELGVRYVLEGSVRKSGDRVRLTAQLNDVATGSQIWAERYDRGLADVFAVQDEITDAIVSSIEPQLYAAENFRARRKTPDSMDAWDLVMRALSHFLAGDAAGLFRRRGSAGKGDQLSIRTTDGRSACWPRATCSRAHMGWIEMTAAMIVAERSAHAAICADSEDPWAHHALGHVYLFARKFDDSLAEFELALRLNPNFSLAQGFYGLSLAYSGRWEEAASAAGRALRLSPRDPFSAIYTGVSAYSHFLGGDYDRAMQLAREAVRARNDFVGAYRVLVAAAGMAGHAAIAGAALKELCRTQPNVSLAWIATEMPFKKDEDRAHYLEGFRRAGLR